MKHIVKISVLITMLMTGFFLAACNSNKQDSSKDTAQDQNQATFKDSKQDKNNAQFVVDVAAANYDEIGLSSFAVKNSANKNVKDFAEMMIMDHTKALDALKAVAERQNISIPANDSEKVNREIKSWQSKTPNEFNRDYIDKMVDDHKATVDKLSKADTEIANSDIHSWIENTLPTVREHLQKVSDLQKSVK